MCLEQANWYLEIEVKYEASEVPTEHKGSVRAQAAWDS